MSLKTRRFLFIIFLASFFIITPLVIISANGYKLSLQGKVLQKTGMLVLDSNPRGAKIYINDKPKKLFLKIFNRKNNFMTTPVKIKNILPGEYKVKIEKDGYWSWEKKLTVQPGMATFAEDINLFKNNLPALISSGDINDILLSPDDKSLLISANDESYFYNASNDTKIPFNAPISTSTENFLWLNNNMALINGFIYRANNPDKLLDLNKYFNFSNSIIRPNYQNKDEIFYVSASNGVNQSDRSIEKIYSINKFNIVSKKIDKIITSEFIDDFIVKDKNLFVINKIADNTSMRIDDIDSGQTVRLINLPDSDGYEFINPDHRLINLFDKNHQTLYLIDLLSPNPLREGVKNIKLAYWVDDNRLLYANDFEIWLSDFSNNKTSLITRISEEINGVIWHPSENYIIYSTNNSIYSIELDDREKRSITQLIKLDEVSNLIASKNGKVLYFFGKIGNQKGLYRLIIQ